MIILCASTTQAFSVLSKDKLWNFISISTKRVPPTDSLSAKKDSTEKKGIDSLATKPKKTKEGIKTAVTYTSEDSIVFDAETQTMKLYKDSKIDYGDMSLKAEQIDINWLNNNVEARGVPDSTGKLIGNPLFKEKQDEYQTKKIVYNFKTKKGIISEVVTKQGDGFIHGEKVKKNEKNELFAQHSQYTTCNLAEPHYSISSTKIKMIPEKKIISGPFNLVVNKVPTPLGFLFGYFPVPKTRASGFIIPSYGEQQTRGFFLQGGGFYWAVSDYVGMKFTVDVYSLGGGGAQQITDYRKRYAYSGLFNFKYNWIKTYNNVEPSKYINTHQFWVIWNHSTMSKKPGRLTVNINAGTSSYNQYATTPQSVSQTMAPAFQSSISYSRTFRNSPFNMALNLRQDQRVDGVKNFTLPDLSLNMNRVMPFQNVSESKKMDIVRKLNVSYNMNFQNRVTNDPSVIGYKPTDSIAPDGTPVKKMYTYSDDLGYLFSAKNLNNGIRHSIPISTSFKVLKYFSVNPNMSWDEFWYNRHFDYRDTTYTRNGVTRDTLLKDTVTGFSRAYQYSMGSGLTTRVYGTFFLPLGRLEAIRHTFIPNITYSYRPDFSEESYGFYERHQLNNDISRVYSKYQGLIMGSPGAGKTSALGLTLNNTFEMKVRNKSDTATGKNKYRKISLLDNLSAAGNYNFATDTFKLSYITLAARTKLFGMFDVAGSMVLDAYERSNVRVGEKLYSVRRDTFLLDKNAGLANVVTSFLNFRFDLGSQKFKKSKKEDLKTRAEGIKNAEGIEQQELQRIKNNPNEYLDFTIPWNLSISYNLTYQKLNNPGTAPDIYNHSITCNGDLTVTEKWKLQYSTGYNLTQKNVTYTRMSVVRDLHCWTMSLNWVPPIPGAANTGTYYFQLNVKSSVLQDLKVTRNRAWTDVTQ